MDALILQRARELAPRLIEIRRNIHQHPELGFLEHRTAALVADVLGSLGIDVQTGVGKTGVIGNMGGDGPIVALRADMDALPLQEHNQVEYASKVPGVMHACGHDVHTACLLGAAMLLNEVEIDGQVRFLFQPSEEGMDDEGKSGAMRMVEEGAFENVEAVFGLHVDSKYKSGEIACSPGYIMAALDNFKITVMGHSAHAAQAYLGVDAIHLASQIITTLHTIISRHVHPLDGAVISIGTIHGGTKENNLADRVEITGTIRSFDPQVRRNLIQEIHNVCSLARTQGGDYQFSLIEGYPALRNDSILADFACGLARELVGDEAVVGIQPEMGAEDFSFYTQQSPGCYLILGVQAPGQPRRPLHNPEFDIDESVIPLGAAMMAQLAIRCLEDRPLRQHQELRT